MIQSRNASYNGSIIQLLQLFDDLRVLLIIIYN